MELRGQGWERGADPVSRRNDWVEDAVGNYCKRREEEQVVHEDNLGFKVLR